MSPSTTATPMHSAFQRIISDLKTSCNIQSGLQQLVMMRFNLTMATDSALKNLLKTLPTTDDENLDRLKKIVMGKIECMEYVDDAKKMTKKTAAECSDTTVVKTKKRPATNVLDAPVSKRPCQPPMQIDDDFFCRKRTAPKNFAPKPKAPITPAQPISTVATSRPQSTSNSLDLMKKCKEVRLAKQEKQNIVNQKTVQDTKSWRETFREQRIKEKQDRNNGIMPKIDKKHRRMY